MKYCKKCCQTKTDDEFHRSSAIGKKTGERALRNLCKPCETARHREYVSKNRERLASYRRENYRNNKLPHIETNLKRYYGMNLADYDKMLKEQKSKCKICGIHQDQFERRFDVDHNHKTKVIRGLLCIRCNRGIGLLKDCPKIMERAMRYLKSEGRIRSRG